MPGRWLLICVALVIALPILVISVGTSASAGLLIGIVLFVGGGLWWLLGGDAAEGGR